MRGFEDLFVKTDTFEERHAISMDYFHNDAIKSVATLILDGRACATVLPDHGNKSEYYCIKKNAKHYALNVLVNL